MRALLFSLVLLAFASCITSVCVENIEFSEDNFIAYPDRPDFTRSVVSFDRTISHHAEPHVLKAFQITNDSYYVEFYPVRAQSRLYGPFNGTFSEDVQCEP